jgi:hypothetical protein
MVIPRSATAPGDHGMSTLRARPKACGRAVFELCASWGSVSVAGEHTTVYPRREGRRHPTVLEVPVVDAPDLLTFAAGGRRLQVSRWSVYQLIWAGELPSIHLGRCHRVRVRDCEAYVARLGGGEST